MRKDKFEDFDFIDFKESSSQDNNMLVDMLDTLSHHRKWFILSIVVCLLAGYIYIRSTPKTYTRTATILVKDDKKGSSGGQAAAFQDVFSLGSNSVDNELGFFKSKRLMLEVVKRLNLNVSYKERNGLRKSELYTSTPLIVTLLEADPKQSVGFTATILNEKQVELSDMVAGVKYKQTLKVQLGDTTDTPIGRLVIASTPFMSDGYIGQPIYVSKENLKAVSDDYNNKLNAEIGKQSSLINLTLEDENISRAEDVLNTLIEVYEKDVIDDKNKVVINTSNFIKGRLAIIETDLGIVDSEIENYKKKNKLTDITSESALFLQNTGYLDSKGLSVENQLNMAEYMKSYLQDNSKAVDLIPASIGINDMGIQSQIGEYNMTVTKRNKFLANSSANHPIVQDLNASIASMRQSVLKSVDNLIAGLKMQVTNMKSKERENRSKISDVPTQQKIVISIERQQKIKEELYLYLLNKKEENELQLSITESNCRIVDPANGSASPVSPKKIQVILICLVVSVIIPALCLYIRSLFNTNIHTRKEIKTSVNIPFLGEIPLEKRKYPNDIVVKEGSREGICEAFNILHDNLDFMNAEGQTGGKVIQLTSFNANSGKTFITTNLAMSMALSNSKVIVLDLDLRKGTLTKKSDIGTKHPGLSAYLSGKATQINELIRPFQENSRLDILTSGTLPPNPAELLKGDKLDQLIAELKKSYDYILLDNPPYGLVVDASLCARTADQTICVIRSGLFDKRQLPELQELYDSQKMHNMSVILNAIDYDKVSYGYGHGYGYGYGYGNDKDANLRKKCFLKRLFGL